MKGPDFPLGGKIVTDRATLRKIYEEGTRHASRCRASGRKRSSTRASKQIVVTSIPYGVDKGELEQTIGAHHRGAEAAATASGQSNESNDKDGLRLVLEVKPGTDPNLVMAYLYKHTELQKTFSYNMTALVPGRRTARRWSRRTG